MHKGRYTNTYIKQLIKKARLVDDYLEVLDGETWGTPVRRKLAYNLTGEMIILMCDLEEAIAERLREYEAASSDTAACQTPGTERTHS